MKRDDKLGCERGSEVKFSKFTTEINSRAYYKDVGSIVLFYLKPSKKGASLVSHPGNRAYRPFGRNLL